MKEKCCKTCKWSRWSLTKSGRIVKNVCGQCVVPLPVIALPICVTEAYGYREWSRCLVSQHDGGNCPLYEANTGKPIKSGQ